MVEVVLRLEAVDQNDLRSVGEDIIASHEQLCYIDLPWSFVCCRHVWLQDRPYDPTFDGLRGETVAHRWFVGRGNAKRPVARALPSSRTVILIPSCRRYSPFLHTDRTQLPLF